ncbi:DNA polymerase alpha/epsilon subunit B-domain-containing protein [Favolaschia claudopus]|uniref:DNA polymerase epsilon subunit n=1 Tax=Favolaschia claudopus TaxID=2862362 RepID=A0AAW0DUL9_9AGAR
MACRFKQHRLCINSYAFCGMCAPKTTSLLDNNEIEDADVESSIEIIAREYNKQDDATMKVSIGVLQRVYESLQDRGQRTDQGKEAIDPESHLFVIDAFEMPLWNWSSECGTFEKFPAPLTMSGTPESQVFAMRNRFNIIRQCVLRNEHFAPSTLPSRDRERLVPLKSTKQLLGRAGERFLLLGMLAHSKEGKLCIEDADGSVELDFSKLDEPGDGLFTEGCFALVEGEYTEDGTLEIIAIGQPPCDPGNSAKLERFSSIYGHIEFRGKGATSLLEDSQLSVRVREELSDLNFFFLSDVWLDNPRTLPALQKMFENCVENRFVRKLIVLCGNLTSKSISHGQGRDVQCYQENFDALADLIASYPMITRSTHFVFVPGPLDVAVNSILPRRPLLSSFVGRLKTRVLKVHFATNPCRIKFFDQRIVVLREDLMAKMLRNVVGVKPDARSDDLKKFLVRSILNQSHLCPLTVNIQVTLSDYDHSLRLYPLPTDCSRYKVTYTGCHVFNPVSFVGGISFVFSTVEEDAEE